MVKGVFHSPGLPLSPAALRITVTLTLLLQGYFLGHDFLEYYGENGIIQLGLNEYLVDGDLFLPRILFIADRLSPWNISFDQTATGIFLIYMISLIFLLLGWMTRLSSIVACILHLILLNSAPITNYGADKFAQILLFYFTFMPVSRVWSMDGFSHGQVGPITPTAKDTLSLRLLQLHLCLVYWQSGYSKSAGYMWWNGEAIWRSVMSPEYSQMDLSWLAQVPWFATFLGVSTVIIEMGYPLLIWPKRTRFLWVTLTLLLHLGIGPFMGLWIFSFIMMAQTICAFGIPEMGVPTVFNRGFKTSRVRT